MKKTASLIALVGVVIAALAAYMLLRETAKAPEVPAEDIATTTETDQTPSVEAPATPAPAPAPASAPSTAPSVGTAVSNTVVLPGWSISLTYKASWKASESGGLVTIEAPNSTFLLQKDKAIAEPQKIPVVEKTRVVAGKTVETRRFYNPNENYAMYEYFSLRAGGDTYYFKVKANSVPDDPDIDTFLKAIKIL